MTLWDLVVRRAEATPDAQMAVDEAGRTLTFAEYRTAAEDAAVALDALGVGEGDVVSWQLPTWLESMVLLAALARLGAVQNPMLPIYRRREMTFIARQAGTRLLIVPGVVRGFDHRALALEVAADVPGLDVAVVDRWLPDPQPNFERLRPDSGRRRSKFGGRGADSDVRWLYYTSGTTGEPKGARHTDASVIAGGRSLAEGMQVTGADREALVFPFAHIGGAIWLVAGLLSGCAHLVVEAFDPGTTIDFLARQRVTLAGAGTPFHLAYLARQRTQPGTPLFPDVRAFPGGASPKPPQLHYEMQRELGGVGILSSWGLTEAPILTVNAPGDPDEELATSEGRPGPDVEVTVADDGELRVRGPQVFAGYVDAALDADAFDDAGWLRTGDLGRIDDHGSVVITGRLKDVIIRKGENISAKEVEDLLYRHDKVADVAVIGLPDPEVGERCCAVVVPATPGDPLAFDEMATFLRGEGLMVQKVPERLEVVDALPRNIAGKVLKHELRARYR